MPLARNEVWRDWRSPSAPMRSRIQEWRSAHVLQRPGLTAESHPAVEESPRPCAEPERNRQREPGVNPHPREQLESERAKGPPAGKSSVCQFVGKRRSERPAGLGGISEEKRAREIRPEAEEREQHEGRLRGLAGLAGGGWGRGQGGCP